MAVELGDVEDVIGGIRVGVWSIDSGTTFCRMEPIRRYARAAPGEIIHIDLKKLRKFNRIDQTRARRS